MSNTVSLQNSNKTWKPTTYIHTISATYEQQQKTYLFQ